MVVLKDSTVNFAETAVMWTIPESNLTAIVLARFRSSYSSTS
jgi:hypothetical protein